MKKTNVVSFRLTDEEIKPYLKVLNNTNLKRSELFREIFLHLSPTIKVDKEKEESLKFRERAIFYYNKTSNNLNQIARQVNIFAKYGEINNGLAKEILETLLSIECEFKKGIDKGALK